MSIWSLKFPLALSISDIPAVDILPLWASTGPSLSILCINWNVFLFIQRGIWWPLVVLCMRADTIFNVPLILWVCMQEEIKYWCPAVVFYEQKPFGNSKQSWTICPAERRWSLLSKCKLEMFLSTAQNSQCNAIANHLKFPLSFGLSHTDEIIHSEWRHPSCIWQPKS